MRIVFMGSPAFAVPVLSILVSSFEVAGVVTQPDRPAGRGRELRPPEIKILAQSLGLPFIQPQRLRDEGVIECLNSWKADVFVVAAFGQILRQEILDLPACGSINVHASLLPRWRGAAPVQASILAGDEESGVTIIKMDAGIDTGPILSHRQTPIKPDDTGGDLSQRLAEIGAELLLETLPEYLLGNILPRPQDKKAATYAPLLRRSDGLLHFAEPAETLARQVRAYHPWPASFIVWKGKRIIVHKATAVDNAAEGQPGEVMLWRHDLAVVTGKGLLLLELVQPAGGKVMSGAAFARGAVGFLGSQL